MKQLKYKFNELDNERDQTLRSVQEKERKTYQDSIEMFKNMIGNLRFVCQGLSERYDRIENQFKVNQDEIQ